MGETDAEKQYLFDKPENVNRLLRGFYIGCVLLALLDVVGLILHLSGGHALRHTERSYEGLPGFYAGYGFVACVVLVLIATQMRKALMRDEDYYDG